MDVQLRVISPQDWAVFRALRLRALADSPLAFGVTLAEATANAEPMWRDRAGEPDVTADQLQGHIENSRGRGAAPTG